MAYTLCLYNDSMTSLLNVPIYPTVNDLAWDTYPKSAVNSILVEKSLFFFVYTKHTYDFLKTFFEEYGQSQDVVQGLWTTKQRWYVICMHV